MKHLQKLILLAAAVILLAACKGGADSYLPGVSGKAGEVLVVTSENIHKTPIGNDWRMMLSEDVEGMNWDEPQLDVSSVTLGGFSDMLKPSRNLLMIEVSNKYTKNKVIFKKSVWGKGQAFVKVQAADTVGLRQILDESGKKIVNFYLEAERKRLIDYFKDNAREDWTKRVKDSTGVDIPVPAMFTKQKFANDFIWLSSGTVNQRADLLIYWYDYTDSKTFTPNFLIAKRDSILKNNVPGPRDGSFMTTEKAFAPFFNELALNGNYVAELRGMWKVEGDLMGGPFISHTQLFKGQNKVVTIEGFVYAPNQLKRDLMRRLEAVMYSVKLPEEKN